MYEYAYIVNKIVFIVDKKILGSIFSYAHFCGKGEKNYFRKRRYKGFLL